MKKIITTLIFLIICKTSFSQTIKNFDSVYNNGRAKFQYYDGQHNEIILNGKFTFFQKNTITETGEYRNNLKVGQWDYVDTADNEYVKVSGKYKDDLKDGVWNSIQTDGSKKLNYILNFKKDTLVGKINIDGLTGQFTADGKYIGDWKMECDDYLYKASFIDNILVKLTRERLINHSLVGEYNPDISKIDFLKLTDESNHIVRQKYDLVGITRVLVDDFQTSKIYGVPDYDEKLQEQLFYYFFDCIESKIGDFLFLDRGWNSLKFSLINNPDFLYLIEPTKEIQAEKIKKRRDFEKVYGPVVEYDQIAEKPSYPGETDNFIKFIRSNYRNTGNVSGRLFIEVIIGRNGKLHIVKTTCSGNLSCEEINRILNISPNWIPGKQNGKFMNVKVAFPIIFQKMENE